MPRCHSASEYFPLITETQQELFPITFSRGGLSSHCYSNYLCAYHCSSNIFSY